MDEVNDEFLALKNAIWNECSVPEQCQREMSQILHDLEGLISVIDDMLVISGKTQQEHYRTLKDVLKKLGGVEATLFQFLENILKKEVKCARPIVNEDRIKSNPKKTEFIRNMASSRMWVTYAAFLE